MSSMQTNFQKFFFFEEPSILPTIFIKSTHVDTITWKIRVSVTLAKLKMTRNDRLFSIITIAILFLQGFQRFLPDENSFPFVKWYYIPKKKYASKRIDINLNKNHRNIRTNFVTTYRGVFASRLQIELNIYEREEGGEEKWPKISSKRSTIKTDDGDLISQKWKTKIEKRADRRNSYGGGVLSLEYPARETSPCHGKRTLL